jgi:Domain of unknown function (DUF927)/Toprim domain
VGKDEPTLRFEALVQPSSIVPMTSERYVATEALRRAICGREAEVLRALGIEWKKGAHHISCPYPDHADQNPSWRWDGRKARAFCTCITQRGGHSILEIVKRVEGIDFEAAKLRVAEILGRSDLIETRGQRMDAASLLQPPPAQRDGALGSRYLGYRLGAPSDAVPMPATRVVGWRELPYYDPPAAKTEEATLVGRYPCVVFATVAPDGRQHAHRIYVAQDGQGKAELGADTLGGRRDPKKSARLNDGQSAAGCAVLWGDPATAPHLLVAEGIETAGALALAYREEVEAGSLAVAAALSTSGLRTFAPWSATRTITIAADRDEGCEVDDRGYRAGERAARSFALGPQEGLEIRIALPGQEGEDVDWLDVLRRDGVQAVRAGLDGAKPFAPTQQEINDARQRAESASALDETERSYPLPVMESMTLAYLHTRSGRIMVHKYAGRDKQGEEVWLPVATPFGVPARLRYIHEAEAYGLRVVVQGMDDQPRALDFERGSLARMNASELRSRLFAAGLRTEDDGEHIVVKALKAADPAFEITVVSRSGWHLLAGLEHPVFVAPNGEIVGATRGSAIELSAGVRLACRAIAGTLQDWQQAVAAATGAANCPHFILGLLCGLAGPIQALAGLDSCGINLSGLSSSGKTLSQRLAVSVWSSTGLGSGLLQSLRTTENAVESIAQLASGTVLALDEVAHIDGRILGRMVYSIAGGQGKARLSSEAVLRQRYSWTTFILLSGECSLEEKVREDDGQWMAGMAVRILDVDVTSVNRAVPQDVLARIDGILKHHGHAGPAFARRLVQHGYHARPDELRQTILNAARRIGGKDADSLRIRAALVFALLPIAGGLAKEFGLLPQTSDVEGAVKWGWQQFDQSSDALALKPELQIIVSLTTWVAQRLDVTIKPIEPAANSYGPTRTNNRDALGWYDNEVVYLPTNLIREASGGALKETQIARILDEQGYLAKRESARRLAVRYVPKIGKSQCYALSKERFGWGSDEEPEFTVYQGGRQ